METGNSLQRATRKLTRRLAPILLAVFAVLLGVALPGARHATHASAALAASPGIPPGLPSNIAPCGVLGPNDGSRPSHPYRPGDPICSLRGHGVPDPSAIRTDPVSGSAQPFNTTDQRNMFVQNNIEATGIYAGRQVTAISHDSNDTVYVTMHAGQDYVNGPWIEIGWYQFGSGARGVFTCCANVGFLSWPQFPINTGDTIWVEVEAFGNNQWSPLIYWNGQWTSLNTYTLAYNYTTQGNVTIEAFSGGDGSYPTIPQTNTYDAQEYVCNPMCGWQPEGPATEGGGTADLPYCITPVNTWYNLYGYGPVVSSCP